jgi:demethoxyubiquinone hydroxylase (CLK1/Coq7/Cat5 family)
LSGQPNSHDELIRILQNAFSGELAAAYAYRGHWKSLQKVEERSSIQRIEHEEWVHRERVGDMLEALGARPLKIRELKMWLIGRTIGLLCHLIGWFLPMYFAGRLESGNIKEYEDAALHAGSLGLADYQAELLVMSGVEREHELFFFHVVADHKLLPFMRRLFRWGWPEKVLQAKVDLHEPPEVI